MPPQSEPSFIGIELSGSKTPGRVVNNEGVIGDRREAQLRRTAWSVKVAQLVSDLRQVKKTSRLSGLPYRVWLTGQTDRVVASRDIPG